MNTEILKYPFYLGDWCVIPEQCRLQNSEISQHLQPKLMEVLLFLVEHAAQVVSTDDLINACWKGQPMTDNPIHKTIAQLRKALGDSSDAPKYIKTIPRKGYIMVAQLAKDRAIPNQIEAFWCDQTPFMGSAAFQSHQNAIFFGRQQSLDDLLSHIEKLTPQDTLLLNVSGVSGCGKSSFIQAAVIPQLLNPFRKLNLQFSQAITWQVSSHNSINDLLKLLYQHKVFAARYDLGAIQRLAQQQPNDLAKCLVKNESGVEQRSVLFIDQIEQWLPDDTAVIKSMQDIEKLFEIIEVLNNTKHFFIIFSVRDEAKIGIEKLPVYQSLSNAVIEFRLPMLKHADYQGWIRSTVQAAGLFFEVNTDRHENLLDVLVDSIERHQCSLSTVQIILLKLYEQRDNSKLQYTSYNQLGGLKGIINQHVESIYIEQNKQQQHHINQMFPYLVVFESLVNNEAQRRQMSWQQAKTGLGMSLITELINRRLLCSAREGSQVMVSLTEPSLPLLWSRLAEWVLCNRNHLLKQSEVQFLTARWMLKGQKNVFLMSKQDMDQFSSAKQSVYFLTDNQKNYFTASQIKARRSHNIKRSLQFLSVLVLMGTLGITMYAYKTNGVQNQTQQQLNRLITYITNDLSPQLKNKGQLALLEETHEKLLQVIQASEQNNPNQSLKISHVASLNTLGDLSFNHRDSTQALTYFKQSEQIINRSGDNDSPELLAHMMLSQYWIGYLGFVESNYSQAHEYWQAYLHTSLRLREIEPDNSQWQLEHSYALNNLGSLSERTGELQQAADFFAESIAIKTGILSDQPDDMSLQADLADSLSWQGNIFRKQGALKLALDAYQDSIVLTQSMKAPKNKSNTKLHREILAFIRMATLILDMGDLTEAQKLASSALEKSLLLNELERQNNDYKAELISLQLINAQIYRYLQDYDSSLKHIQKANQLIDYFKINLNMTARIASFQMHLKREQALIFKHFGQNYSALTTLEDGLQTWQDYDLSQNQKSQISYALIHLNIAQLLMQEQPKLNQQSHSQTINNHLNKARQEIDYLLTKNPADFQLMAINLAISYTRNGVKSHHEYLQALRQSEYRNPEHYLPLFENQVISLN